MATSAADLPGLPATLEQWSACVDGGPFSSNPAIEAACLALPAFQRAHPDNQPDNPDNSRPENN